MKKILFTLLAIGVIIISCKKDHSKENTPKPPVGALQKVTFKAAFSISTGYVQVHSLSTNSLGTSSTPDTALTNHIKELYYMVFDSAGNNLHNIQQLSTDTAFGHYVDNLHPGKYTIAIAGGTGFTVQGGKLTAPTGAVTPAYCYSNPFAEFFFGKTVITVNSSSLSQSVNLDRKTSKLVVNIKDALPTQPASLGITLSGAGTKYYIGYDSIGAPLNAPNSAALSYSIPASARGTTNYQIAATFFYDGPFTVDLSCTSTSSNFIIYGEKVISGVAGGRNKITTLTGNLFGGSGTSQTGGFQATLDTTWTTPVNVSFP